MTERNERASDVRREPTWGVNTHVGQLKPAKECSNFFLNNMYYIYQYEEDDIKKIPSQICPVAFVSIEYINENV